MPALLNHYPAFELFEIEPELSLQLKKYRPLNIRKEGHSIDQLTFNNDHKAWQQFFNGAQTHDHLSIRRLLSKPLVVNFYSHHWKEEGLVFLKQLNEINAGIKAAGGNLVVITDSPVTELEKLAWEHNLTLNFYFDPSHKLATNFGVYHKNSPVWERFSGVDADVSLLASFVLTPYRQVVFSYSNWDMQTAFDTDKLLAEVYQSALYHNIGRSA